MSSNGILEFHILLLSSIISNQQLIISNQQLISPPTHAGNNESANIDVQSIFVFLFLAFLIRSPHLGFDVSLTTVIANLVINDGVAR